MRWPWKKALSAGLATSASVSASGFAASAAAMPISAVKPVLLLVGLAMPKVKRPLLAASAMSFHVGSVLSQPSSAAFEAFTPRITGDSMILSCAWIRGLSAGFIARYLPWLTQTASKASPAPRRSMASSVPA